MYFSAAEMLLVGGPTMTDAFRFSTAPVLVMLVKRDAIGLIMINEVFDSFFIRETFLDRFDRMDLRNFNNIESSKVSYECDEMSLFFHLFHFLPIDTTDWRKIISNSFLRLSISPCIL